MSRIFFLSGYRNPTKPQGTKARYARRKHRGSTKLAKAAIAAVKLATACAQGRPLVKLATTCAQGLETFSKVWRMSHIVRNKGKSTTAYKEVREDTFVLKFLY